MSLRVISFIRTAIAAMVTAIWLLGCAGMNSGQGDGSKPELSRDQPAFAVGKVQAIDKKKRVITLKYANGDRKSVV
jgi:hypothetical protein